eukprot:TRINITY_DN15150_c0_g1_i2.p1 TRINITY_DN15150_c0_g1~~TRINITY_DN15150_c0_g1_i2.p1  ORF type:complete len:726 (+),score=161.48 TRINITY_DN15150_c0_g1_i2:57-2234(+)
MLGCCSSNAPAAGLQGQPGAAMDNAARPAVTRHVDDGVDIELVGLSPAAPGDLAVDISQALSRFGCQHEALLLRQEKLVSTLLLRLGQAESFVETEEPPPDLQAGAAMYDPSQNTTPPGYSRESVPETPNPATPVFEPRVTALAAGNGDINGEHLIQSESKLAVFAPSKSDGKVLRVLATNRNSDNSDNSTDAMVHTPSKARTSVGQAIQIGPPAPRAHDYASIIDCESQKYLEEVVRSYCGSNSDPGRWVRRLGETRGPVYRFLKSILFARIISFVIFLNAAWMAGQTQYLMNTVGGEDYVWPSSFRIVDRVFVAVFTAELVGRMCTERLIFFLHKDEKGWNIFDFSLVVLSFCEEFIALLAENNSEETTGAYSLFFLRLLRLLRVVRIARIFRVLRFFAELRVMLFSLMGCFWSLIWLFCLLLMILFIFGLAFMQSSLEYLNMYKDDASKAESCDKLVGWFGTVPLTILSLFKAFMGGIDWEEMQLVLREIDLFTEIIFYLFIFFSIFGVMNVVTGVFAERASTAALRDRTNAIQAVSDKKDAFAKEVLNIFMAADQDRSGTVTLRELTALFDNPTVRSYFDLLELGTDQIVGLFDILDPQGNGCVEAEDFVAVCTRIRGGAKGIDLALLAWDFRRFLTHFEMRWNDFAGRLENMGEQLQATSRFLNAPMVAPYVAQERIRPVLATNATPTKVNEVAGDGVHGVACHHDPLAQLHGPPPFAAC